MNYDISSAEQVGNNNDQKQTQASRNKPKSNNHKPKTNDRNLSQIQGIKQQDSDYYESQFEMLPEGQREALGDGIQDYYNGVDPTATMNKDQKQAYQFGANAVDKISMGQSLSDNEKETIHDMNPEEKQAMMTGMSYEGMRQRYPDRAGQGMTETQQKNLEDFEKTGHLPDANADKKPNGDVKPTAVNEIDPSSTNLNPTYQNGVQNGNSLSQPNDGGVDVQVDGHNVHLQPGTSMTIGKDGQISISSNQFNPSTATSTSFPGTAAGNDPAFSSVNPLTSAGVVAGNVSPQVSAQSTNYELGSRVQKADKLRDYYSQKGMSTTDASLGNQQTTALSSALQDKDKQNSASLGLNVDKNNEMTL